MDKQSRHLLWVVALAGLTGLGGCQSIPILRDRFQAKPVAIKPLPPLDLQQPEPFIDRFKPHGFSLGAWVNRKDGELFQPIRPASTANALVYLYRPHSRWNQQEILAPNFFLNGVRLPSLINATFYWVELPPGDYRMLIRRPIGVVNFQKGTTADFTVKAGKTYYLRYDEENFRPQADPALNLLKAGPLSQIPEMMALREMRETIQINPGRNFAPDRQAVMTLPRGVTGRDGYAVRRVQLRDQQALNVGVPFVWYNPLTW